jgi:MYXO-CTERM domain-containing protein
MNRHLVASLVVSSVLIATGFALAQPPPPAASAAADQAFSPGPGGGDPDAGDGRPPLESTGLEDSIGGSCGCRTAGAPLPLGWAWPAVGLVAVAVARIRRRAPRRR